MTGHDIYNEDYEDAVKSLFSSLHQAVTPDEIRAASDRRTNTLQDMYAYLYRLGLDLNNNRADCTSNGSFTANCKIPQIIFHITGTKGKGSTLAFCENILRSAYKLNTGMFTSPHLVTIRERIRINGLPVSKEMFAHAYWIVKRKLEQFDESCLGKEIHTSDDQLPPLPKLPGYFRMLTLMAIYTFCHCESPKIDVILLEVGMGGRYDATNIFEPLIAPDKSSTTNETAARILMRGVTLIDYDHTRVLGSSLEQIAWEKGGIFASNKLSTIGRNYGGYLAFLDKITETDQRCDNTHISRDADQTLVFANGNNTARVLSILRHVVKNDSNTCYLEVIHDSSLDESLEIGIEGNHQRSNAALAVAMCQEAMNQYSPSISSCVTSDQIRQAIANASWPGRSHSLQQPIIVSEDKDVEVTINLRCDGAHTPISIKACIDWFRSVSKDCGESIVYRVLLFNCSHERNPLPLLYSLLQSNLFDLVYFCQADCERPSMVPKTLNIEWVTSNIEQSGVMTLENMVTLLEDVHSCQVPFSCTSTCSWQETLANIWSTFSLYQQLLCKSPNAIAKVEFGLDAKTALTMIKEETMTMLRHDQRQCNHARVEICVTGSLYIVGSALEAAGWQEPELCTKS